MPSTSPARRHDLDWLRIVAFAVLIFYHIGMFYVTWGWHIKSPHASPTLEPAMLLVNPWRLALLFFISGVALRFALDKAVLRAFLPARIRRLLIPIAFGMLVVVMPQAYAELRVKGEIGPDFWSFYLRYLLPPQDFSILTPTWNHLWYVVYILVYTLVLAALLPLLRRIEGLVERAIGWLSRYPLLLFVLPLLPFLAYTAWLNPLFPTTHTLIDDWANHAHSFTILLFGYWVAKNDAFWRAIDRLLPFALGIALVSGAAMLALRFNAVQGNPVRGMIPFLRTGYAWAVIVTVLAFAQRYLVHPGKALTYLTQAVFPYYILHQTLIVMIGFTLLGTRMPLWAEASIVTIGTIAGCGVLYEIIRRVPFLRPLFGLPPTAQAAGRALMVSRS